ncbi:hypothetical protein NC652_041131 [Populus alba x Populus x berolinensis]|nr:hypothetical protein NC652_041131 [Populus alba x Populus x berolinensis]
MAPEKLAELWALDPNEPKAGISKRDTSSLTTENSELKLRLQAMEQQAELRDGMLLRCSALIANPFSIVGCIFLGKFLVDNLAFYAVEAVMLFWCNTCFQKMELRVTPKHTFSQIMIVIQLVITNYNGVSSRHFINLIHYL